jgi:hypothetical protein
MLDPHRVSAPVQRAPNAQLGARSMFRFSWSEPQRCFTFFRGPVGRTTNPLTYSGRAEVSVATAP